MILKLLKRQPRTTVPAIPSVPAGTVVWAVGDVHGRLDLLQPLVDAILADAAGLADTRKVVIFLGDYVDRGAQSREVIQYLASLPQDDGIEWRFLKGNHEETMLNFLEDPTVGAQWCEYGGAETLRSYGLRIPDMRHQTAAWAHLSADFRHRITPSEVDFLQGLELSITVGDYFFAHAGARPGLPLDRQSARDLMWIRQSFLDSPAPFDRVVVHGHTPTVDVHADGRRLGIDTKAYSSGILTAVRLRGEERLLLQTVGVGENATDVTVRIRELA